MYISGTSAEMTSTVLLAPSWIDEMMPASGFGVRE